MADVAKGSVLLTPRFDGLKKSIEGPLDSAFAGAESLANKHGAGAGKGFSGAFGGAVKALGGIVAGIGFASLVSEAAAATDATQKFKSTLDFAGLGTDEIEALSRSTRKYADQTVYSLSDIQNITAQLAANSVPNYDRLAEAAGNLNAVAGGNAETFRSVGMVLTQTAGAGKLTTENWNQLADAIPGASGKLQEAMRGNGAYTGNFREAMEKGMISAEEFNAAIMQLGFEDAAVKAATSTSTFEGAFGNMQAAVVGGLSDALAQVQPLVTDGINGLTSVVEGAFSAVNQGIGFVIQGLAQFGQAIAPALQPIALAFQQAQAAFAPVIAQVQAQLMPALSQLGGAITGVITALAPLIATVVSTLAPVIATVISSVASVATTIATSLTPVIQTIGQVIQTVLPIAQAAFQIFGDAVQGVIDTVFPFIEVVISNVMNVIKAVIGTVLALIKGDWEGVWNGIKAIGQTVWNAIGNIIDAGINAAKGVIDSVLSAIKSIWDGAWNGLKDFVSQIWEGIKSGVSNGIDAVMSFIGELPGKITGFFADAGSWLVDSGMSIMQGLADGISGAIGWVTDRVSDAVGAIRNLFPFSPAKEGPFSGRGWVLYSGISIAEALGDGFTKTVPSTIRELRDGMESVRGAFSTPAPAVRMAPAAVDPTGGLTEGDVARAVVSALRSVGAFDVTLDGDVLAGRIAPAIDRELGYRRELGYA